MEQHDRTFLEITHTVLWVVCLGLACGLSVPVGLFLGHEPIWLALGAAVTGALAALTYGPASRLLYHLTGFKLDGAHTARTQRPALWLFGLTLAFGLAATALNSLLGG